MSTKIKIYFPTCPWCDASMKWLVAQDDLTDHVVECRECSHPVRVCGETSIRITATKEPWLKEVDKED